MNRAAAQIVNDHAGDDESHKLKDGLNRENFDERRHD